MPKDRVSKIAPLLAAIPAALSALAPIVAGGARMLGMRALGGAAGKVAVQQGGKTIAQEGAKMTGKEALKEGAKDMAQNNIQQINPMNMAMNELERRKQNNQQNDMEQLQRTQDKAHSGQDGTTTGFG
jgi:hypothetical protein